MFWKTKDKIQSNFSDKSVMAMDCKLCPSISSSIKSSSSSSSSSSDSMALSKFWKRTFLFLFKPATAPLSPSTSPSESVSSSSSSSSESDSSSSMSMSSSSSSSSSSFCSSTSIWMVLSMIKDQMLNLSSVQDDLDEIFEKFMMMLGLVCGDGELFDNHLRDFTPPFRQIGAKRDDKSLEDVYLWRRENTVPLRIVYDGDN
ncbi:hypothetical protein WICPIJ_000685 [Wickerhamomyces pijperi]|uniref:Uncharacterized protein n=1 Tax=Wickerhamomyces pijperi TaxID=599730 RepID=A0A9P8QFS5_WICPI|nr:hypothetical protein WICPIJ_000685 [Wickerhamomyces pijperi]